MSVGRKPHPFGNERHTISCALTSILFRYLIVEVKYPPKELGQKKYSKLGQKVELILRMCETLYGTWKEVVVDSGFYVSRGIFELEWKGVYGALLIKKKNYWPKGVPCAATDAHFEDKDVNNCEMPEA